MVIRTDWINADEAKESYVLKIQTDHAARLVEQKTNDNMNMNPQLNF